jgi:hypothetical protein
MDAQLSLTPIMSATRFLWAKTSSDVANKQKLELTWIGKKNQPVCVRTRTGRPKLDLPAAWEPAHPIRPINFGVASDRSEHDAIVKLVERILAAKRADPDADTSAWEREIDERVYRLYDLTPDEIKIVEESVSNAGRGTSTALTPDKEEISRVVATDE